MNARRRVCVRLVWHRNKGSIVNMTCLHLDCGIHAFIGMVKVYDNTVISHHMFNFVKLLVMIKFYDVHLCHSFVPCRVREDNDFNILC